MLEPVSENHNDLFDVEVQFEKVLGTLKQEDIPVEGLFINADAAFDSQKLRDTCEYYIEKVFDEIIKIPSSGSKFNRVLGDFLSDSPEIAQKIKSKELQDLKEIVTLYNNA